jgi:hypothetical protein
MPRGQSLQIPVVDETDVIKQIGVRDELHAVPDSGHIRQQVTCQCTTYKLLTTATKLNFFPYQSQHRTLVCPSSFCKPPPSTIDLTSKTCYCGAPSRSSRRLAPLISFARATLPSPPGAALWHHESSAASSPPAGDPSRQQGVHRPCAPAAGEEVTTKGEPAR